MARDRVAVAGRGNVQFLEARAFARGTADKGTVDLAPGQSADGSAERTANQCADSGKEECRHEKGVFRMEETGAPRRLRSPAGKDGPGRRAGGLDNASQPGMGVNERNRSAGSRACEDHDMVLPAAERAQTDVAGLPRGVAGWQAAGRRCIQPVQKGRNRAVAKCVLAWRVKAAIDAAEGCRHQSDTIDAGLRVPAMQPERGTDQTPGLVGERISGIAHPGEA